MLHPADSGTTDVGIKPKGGSDKGVPYSSSTGRRGFAAMIKASLFPLQAVKVRMVTHCRAAERLPLQGGVQYLFLIWS